MQKPSKLQKKLWTAFIFLLKFIILALPLHLILWLNLDTTLVQTVTAQNTYYILKLFDQDVTWRGIYVFTDSFAFKFIRDCTAWKSMLAFAALVIASPFVRIKSKGYALLAGIPLIYLINLIRTSSTIYVGIHNPEFLNVVHTLLWREGLIGIIFVMWFFWYRYAKDIKLENYTYLEKLIGIVNKIR